MNNSIWVSWENQIRNKSMASTLGAKLVVFISDENRFIRYISCSFQTIITILKERPKIVFAQNPSIFLNYLLLTLRIIFKYKFVTDAHYAGIIATNGNIVFQKALNLCNRSADLVIVTNSVHERYVQEIGGKAVICEDPLPDIDKYKTGEETLDKMVLFICSFDVDEPYEIVFEAAKKLLEKGFVVWVTGNYKKVNIDPDEYPWVNFCGYLPENDFYSNLFKCSIVLDLTENENCLVCGAYEAMVAEKPLVTSDTESLRSYFTKGTIFTNHSPESIVDAISRADQHRNQLIKDIKLWKEGTIAKQDIKILKIFSELGK